MIIEQISLFAKKTNYKGIELSNPHLSVKKLKDPVVQDQDADWICYDYEPKFAIELIKFADEDWHYSYRFYGKDWENGGVVNELQAMGFKVEKQVEDILKGE